METYVNFCSFKNSIKQICPILAMILLQINQVYSQSPTFNWVQTFGGANSDEGKSLVVDESGNIYMVGNYSDKLALNINGGDVEINSLGDDDIFIAKFNKDNNLLWVKTIGGSHKDSGNDIFLDKNGNIYIVGEFSGTVDFDPNSSVTTKISRGLKDVFILKLNSQGDYQWVYQIGGNNEAEGKALNIDEYGNILVIGNFQSNLLFNEVFQNNLISNGNKDIFIIKIDINGNLIWANSYGGIGEDSGLDAHIDSENEIILTGYFSNNMILPLNGILNLTSDGGFDIFVIKINNFGDLLWAKKIGGIGNDIGYSVVSNDENDILITGGFENTVNFDPIATNFSLTSNGLSDIFYLKCNSAGNFNFVKSIGSTFNDYGNSITIDNNGNSFITGLKSGSFSISEGGGGTGTPQTNSFIAMFNVEGELIWNKSLGNFISPILGNSIKLDKFGNILLTGLFRRTVNFSPTNTIRNYSSFNFSRDAFLLSWNYSNTCIGASISTQPLSIGSIVNGTATFNIATSGTPPYTYQWRKNGIDIPNATNSSYTTPPLELSDNGSSYTCFVTNCNGTNNVISNSAILTVSNNCIPVSITSNPSNQTAIVGNTATFSVSTTGTPPFTYQWRKNGIDIPNATEQTYTTPPLTLADNGNGYSCQVSNCNGTKSAESNIAILTVSINPPLTKPKITLNSANVNFGEVVSILGKKFTQNEKAKLIISSTSGYFQEINDISINSSGEFIYDYPTNIHLIPGRYTVQGIDIKTKTSSSQTFLLNPILNNSFLNLRLTGLKTPFSTTINEDIEVEFQDQMIKGSQYSMIGSKRKYSYSIFVSENGGINWQKIETINGQEFLNKPVLLSFTIKLTSIGENFKIRVQDNFYPENQDISAKFNVVNNISSNIKVTLEWDKSYPTTILRTAPKGIAADGTARIIMNLSKINQTIGSQISNVSVSLNDLNNPGNSKLLGKVKVAIEPNVYSLEANNITTLSANDNTLNKQNYYFWYVAPDDYVGNNPNDINEGERTVDATFTINYVDAPTEIFIKKLTIVNVLSY